MVGKGFSIVMLLCVASVCARAETFAGRFGRRVIESDGQKAPGRPIFTAKGEHGQGLVALEAARQMPGAVPDVTGAVRAAEDEGQGDPPGAAEVRIAPAAAERKGDSRTMDVVATGVGLDAESATQNAFCQAIEQAVGVLVDAETRVKNDEIVTEKVLTFSRGFVQQFSVVRRWEQNGLHYARIRAQVAIHELSAKLKAQNVAVHDVPGELLYRQTRHQILTEEAAAEMFTEALEDYALDKLFRVSIVGQPKQVAKTDTSATLRAAVAVTADLNNWHKFRSALMPFLSRIATKRTVFPPGDWKQARERIKDGNDKAYLAVFRRMSRSGRNVQWDACAVPGSLKAVLKERGDQPFKLHVALVDAEDRPLALVETDIWPSTKYAPKFVHADGGLEYLGPFYWTSTGFGRAPHPAATHQIDLTVDLEKLRDVAKCVAFIKNVSPMAVPDKD